ncbi:LysR family transcriptional regulator [Chitinivorax sp. B]|uniref:LysR family transcriptional regulator n=1 Tax=Chitinivorax sp. B TaxID=2502235 RepID=UPI0010F9150E|nr:LysR family transcriptional regulator [Chitinivorax sp. B]
MDRLTAMRVFVEVVDRGSLSSAADRLDMSRAMVSRYLAALEDWTGVRLLHRTTRKLSLTDAGSETLARCRQMLEIADDLRTQLNVPEDAPRGMLRLTCSMSLGQAFLARVVTAYLKRYPATAVDLWLVDRTVNLVEDRVDLAIRITNQLDPNLIARKLGACRSIVCASPDYLREHGMPQKVEQLALHNCLTYTYFGKSLWAFSKDGEPMSVPVSGNLSANESTVLLAAALSGAGVTMQPAYSVMPWVRSGQLVAILPGYQPNEMGIYGVYASRKQMPATLRTMLDFLVDGFANDPHWLSIA